MDYTFNYSTLSINRRPGNLTVGRPESPEMASVPLPGALSRSGPSASAPEPTASLAWGSSSSEQSAECAAPARPGPPVQPPNSVSVFRCLLPLCRLLGDTYFLGFCQFQETDVPGATGPEWNLGDAATIQKRGKGAPGVGGGEAHPALSAAASTQMWQFLHSAVPIVFLKWHF